MFRCLPPAPPESGRRAGEHPTRMAGVFPCFSLCWIRKNLKEGFLVLRLYSGLRGFDQGCTRNITFPQKPSRSLVGGFTEPPWRAMAEPSPRDSPWPESRPRPGRVLGCCS